MRAVVLKGDFHVPSCDVEECPVCGRQLISCDCQFEDLARSESPSVTHSSQVTTASSGA